jgi:hypothetical protein
MAPTLVREPFHRDGGVYEEKVAGWRMLAYKDGERVRRLVSRNGRGNTLRFADLAASSRSFRSRSCVRSRRVDRRLERDEARRERGFFIERIEGPAR